MIFEIKGKFTLSKERIEELIEYCEEYDISLSEGYDDMLDGWEEDMSEKEYYLASLLNEEIVEEVKNQKNKNEIKTTIFNYFDTYTLEEEKIEEMYYLCKFKKFTPKKAYAIITADLEGAEVGETDLFANQIISAIENMLN